MKAANYALLSVQLNITELNRCITKQTNKGSDVILRNKYGIYTLTMISVAIVMIVINIVTVGYSNNPETTIQNVVDKIEVENTEEPKESTQSVPYIQDELDLLARVIYAEAGSNWISDEHQLAVGSVVLNRIKSEKFPNTLYEVVYQKSPSVQYSCTVNGMINNAPNERAIKNAEYLLTYGSTIPENVVWQAQFPQGSGTWRVIQGHYFCY